MIKPLESDHVLFLGILFVLFLRKVLIVQPILASNS